MNTPRPNRRHVLAGLAVTFAAPALAGPAAADSVNAADFGLSEAAGDADQGAALQQAIDAAARAGGELRLPAGRYHVGTLRFPGNLRVIGSARGTRLLGFAGATVARIDAGSGFVLESVTLGGSAADAPALVIEDADAVTIRACTFGGDGIGIAARNAGGTIENCDFSALGDAAIHSQNGRGLLIRGNRIDGCGNAGIRIWRDVAGRDGAIVTGNAIARIDWQGGGNGQNGNGINVFQADEVIVADNHITDCAFSAVRVNACRNTQVRGNTCIASGEVAIFSEFGFSGSVIAGNIVDGAATGIDITNLDTGGHLATCTGNIVRNILPRSAVNPDTVPVGIYAEADTVVAGNVVETCPGVGIAAGYGPFVRNVSISGNVLTGCAIGIGVTVVDDPRVGAVQVSGNLVAGASRAGVAGMEWQNVVSDDLARDAARYPHVTIADNIVAG